MPGPGGGLVPEGCAWSGGVPGPGGSGPGAVPGPGGGAWWRPPPGRLLLRAVRILLECILVFFI